VDGGNYGEGVQNAENVHYVNCVGLVVIMANGGWEDIVHNVQNMNCVDNASKIRLTQNYSG
jgi:hypothetical protein